MLKSAEFREEKAAQKKARRDIEKLFTVIVRERQGLKGAKLRAVVRVMTDRYYAAIIRPSGKRIEQALVAELEKRLAATSAG